MAAASTAEAGQYHMKVRSFAFVKVVFGSWPIPHEHTRPQPGLALDMQLVSKAMLLLFLVRERKVTCIHVDLHVGPGFHLLLLTISTTSPVLSQPMYFQLQ